MHQVPNDFGFSFSISTGCAGPIKALHRCLFVSCWPHYYRCELWHSCRLDFSLATLLNVWTNIYLLPSILPDNCLWVTSGSQENKPILLKIVIFCAYRSTQRYIKYVPAIKQQMHINKPESTSLTLKGSFESLWFPAVCSQDLFHCHNTPTSSLLQHGHGFGSSEDPQQLPAKLIHSALAGRGRTNWGGETNPDCRDCRKPCCSQSYSPAWQCWTRAGIRHHG